MTSRKIDWLVTTLVVAAAALTTYVAVRALGPGYLDQFQIKRHLEVLEGRTGDPWQYRVLAEYAVGALRAAIELVGLGDASFAFVVSRFLIAVAVFALAFTYLRCVSVDRRGALLGIALLTWSVTQSNAYTDIAFDSYSEIAFFLLAAILILRDRPAWAVALAPLAVLNRETALLLPILFVAFAPSWTDRAAWRRAGIAFALGAVAYAAVRLAFGPRTVILFDGHALGFDLLEFNLTRQEPLLNVLLTVGVLPILAVAGWRYADPRVRRLCITLVPIWVGAHLVLGSIQETRLLLVPIALVLIPLAVAAPATTAGAGRAATKAERPITS